MFSDIDDLSRFNQTLLLEATETYQIEKLRKDLKSEIEKERQERVEADKRNFRRSIKAAIFTGATSAVIAEALITLLKWMLL